MRWLEFRVLCQFEQFGRNGFFWPEVVEVLQVDTTVQCLVWCRYCIAAGGHISVYGCIVHTVVWSLGFVFVMMFRVSRWCLGRNPECPTMRHGFNIEVAKMTASAVRAWSVDELCFYDHHDGCNIQRVDT